jgi:hypothetical protein
VVSRLEGPKVGGEQVFYVRGRFLFVRFDRKELERKERLELTRRHLALALDRRMTRLGREKLNSTYM